MHHQVFVFPTERWIGPTMVIPYLGTITRDTHVAAIVMCRADQGRYLTENFFARYCDQSGAIVDDAAAATVPGTEAFAGAEFQSILLPTTQSEASLGAAEIMATAEAPVPTPAAAPTDAVTTETGLIETDSLAAAGEPKEPATTESTDKESEASTAAAKTAKKEPAKK